MHSKKEIKKLRNKIQKFVNEINSCINKVDVEKKEYFLKRLVMLHFSFENIKKMCNENLKNFDYLLVDKIHAISKQIYHMEVDLKNVKTDSPIELENQIVKRNLTQNLKDGLKQIKLECVDIVNYLEMFIINKNTSLENA